MMRASEKGRLSWTPFLDPSLAIAAIASPFLVSIGLDCFWFSLVLFWAHGLGSSWGKGPPCIQALELGSHSDVDGGALF